LLPSALRGKRRDAAGLLGREPHHQHDNISQTRDLDQTTTEIEGGADAHLGYGMVSYAYNYTQFRNDENDPEHNYGAAIHGAHPGGISAHNTYPDARAWEHVVRLSTTQTGQVAASANLSVGRVENEDSEVARDYYRGEVDLTWRPRNWVSTLLRYRRTHKQDDVSDTTTAALLEAAGLPAEYRVDEDRYSASVTLRPVSRLTLRGDAIRTEHVRTDAEGYSLPANSRKHEWKASAFYRPMRRVSLRGSYKLLLADDETALDTTPTKARRWQAWAGLQPWWFLALNGSWLAVDAENEDANREDERTVAQANLPLLPTCKRPEKNRPGTGTRRRRRRVRRSAGSFQPWRPTATIGTLHCPRGPPTPPTGRARCRRGRPSPWLGRSVPVPHPEELPMLARRARLRRPTIRPPPGPPRRAVPIAEVQVGEPRSPWVGRQQRGHWLGGR